MRISVFILTLNAFKAKRHVAGRLALPFSRLDNVGRETPGACAAAVTDKPGGSMISVRMNLLDEGGSSWASRSSFAPSKDRTTAREQAHEMRKAAALRLRL